MSLDYLIPVFIILDEQSRYKWSYVAQAEGVFRITVEISIYLFWWWFIFLFFKKYPSAIENCLCLAISSFFAITKMYACIIPYFHNAGVGQERTLRSANQDRSITSWVKTNKVISQVGIVRAMNYGSWVLEKKLLQTNAHGGERWSTRSCNLFTYYSKIMVEIIKNQLNYI